MDPTLVGVFGILCLFVFMALGIPIYAAMALAGFLGFSYMSGMNVALSVLGTSFYSTATSYTMSVILLFVLMGLFVSHSGLGEDIFFAMNKWLGHLPGGLASATVGGCALFAAVSGSSVATAATLGVISLTEMRKYKYDPGLAAGTVAAGGTLGILIPPSMGFIIYGMLTEQSVGKLFIAGIFPGILLALAFIFMISTRVYLKPSLCLRAPKAGLKDRLLAVKDIWRILLLFLLVMGGLYFGFCTPTEAGGIGAFGAFVIALLRGRLSLQNVRLALTETVQTTAMIMIIVAAASIFGYFVAITRIATDLADFVAVAGISKYGVLAGVMIVWLILGCLMESLAMTILTVPIFFPLITHLGFDPIWFGVINVIGVEIALVTPPVGLNVYVVGGIAKDIPLYTIFRGIAPFVVVMFAIVVILTIFPQIALFLPRTLMK